MKKWINILKEKKATEFYIPTYNTSGIYSAAKLDSKYCIVSFVHDRYSDQMNAYALIVYIIENMNTCFQIYQFAMPSAVPLMHLI